MELCSYDIRLMIRSRELRLENKNNEIESCILPYGDSPIYSGKTNEVILGRYCWRGRPFRSVGGCFAHVKWIWQGHTLCVVDL
ncbi:hypothetical protein Lalb_Chr11g0074471 [Lupinus albus]|uniref:Uncharacterized protein n=1 Tax=Lupinus albus TaxID=3870 RepID=A0A6A4PTD7_LUPAL|nr:hypothetical protein Lalb_Chr11g0074471 [Lupinus albus]